MSVTAAEQQPQPQAAAAPKPLTTEKEIIDAYNHKRREQQNYMQRISELEGEIHEHNLVYDQLRELDDARRAHRLVGGALIEKTVGQVRPEIQENLNKFNTMIKMLQEQLVRKEKETEDFMTEYKITRRAPAGGNELTQNQRDADDSADKQGGVLA